MTVVRSRRRPAAGPVQEVAGCADSSGVNRRARARVSVRTDIWLGEDGIFTRTPDLIRDLNEDGAFIETDQQFSVGSIVTLAFNSPMSGRLLTATVAVRHNRAGVGIGVQFLDMAPEGRDELQTFVGRSARRAA